MKTTPLVPFLLAVLLAMGCDTSDATHEAHGPGTPEIGNEHGGHADQVQLNNGQPWSPNIETTHGVNSMLALVEGYDTSNGDGVVLKKELTAEFNDIFAKCTMTGESHKQLHNYLTPVHGMLDKLGNQPTAAELSELSAYLGTYGQYFK